MHAHPVQLEIARSEKTQRIHVAIRVVLLAAIAIVGCSSVYWVLYLALPALVALRIVQGGADRYLAEDGPRIVRGLRWLTSAYAYLWLLTDVLPTSAPASPVDLEIRPEGHPTAASALLRIVLGLPAMLFGVVLTLGVGLIWLVGAVAILIRERLPTAIGDFVVLALRFQFRVAAYHLSLVDRYPALETVASLSWKGGHV